MIAPTKTTVQTKTTSKLQLAVACLFLSAALAAAAATTAQKSTATAAKTPGVINLTSAETKYFGGLGLKDGHVAVWQARRQGNQLIVVVEKRYVTNKLSGTISKSGNNYVVTGLLPNTAASWSEDASQGILTVTENGTKKFTYKFKYLKTEAASPNLVLENTVWRGYSSISEYFPADKAVVSMPIYNVVEFSGGKMAWIGPYVNNFFDYSMSAAGPGKSNINISNRVAAAIINGQYQAFKMSGNKSFAVERIADNSIELTMPDGSSMVLNRYNLPAGSAGASVPTIKAGLEAAYNASAGKTIDTGLQDQMRGRYDMTRDNMGMMIDFMGNYIQGMGDQYGGGGHQGGIGDSFNAHFGNNRQDMGGNSGWGGSGQEQNGPTDSFGGPGMMGDAAGGWMGGFIADREGSTKSGMAGGVVGRQDPSNMGQGMFFNDQGMLGAKGFGTGLALVIKFDANFGNAQVSVAPANEKGQALNVDVFQKMIDNSKDVVAEDEKPQAGSERPADPLDDSGGGLSFMPADPADDDPGAPSLSSVPADSNSLTDRAFYPYDPSSDGNGPIGGMFYPADPTSDNGGNNNPVAYSSAGAQAHMQNVANAASANFTANGLNKTNAQVSVSGNSVMAR